MPGPTHRRPYSDMTYGGDSSLPPPPAAPPVRPEPERLAPANRPEQNWAWWLVFLASGVVNLATLALWAANSVMAAATILAVVPLGIVLLTAAATQRSRPEPAATRGWALCWGACIAATAAGFVNTYFASYGTEFAVVYVAPISEELAKGLGLLLLASWGRIRNALDGVVYAFYVAAGFAFLENVFYLTDALNLDMSGRTSGLTGTTFVMRGLVTPYAHPLFTLVFGAAVGLATRKARAASGLLLILGLLLSMLLHGTWNFLAINQYGKTSSLLFAPLMALVAAAVCTSLYRERRRIDRNRTLLAEPIRAIIETDARNRRRMRHRLGARNRLEYELIVRAYFREAHDTDWTRHPPDPATRRSARDELPVPSGAAAAYPEAVPGEGDETSPYWIDHI